MEIIKTFIVCDRSNSPQGFLSKVHLLSDGETYIHEHNVGTYFEMKKITKEKFDKLSNVPI